MLSLPPPWCHLQQRLGCILLHTSPYHPHGNALLTVLIAPQTDCFFCPCRTGRPTLARCPSCGTADYEFCFPCGSPLFFHLSALCKTTTPPCRHPVGATQRLSLLVSHSLLHTKIGTWLGGLPLGKAVPSSSRDSPSRSSCFRLRVLLLLVPRGGHLQEKLQPQWLGLYQVNQVPYLFQVKYNAEGGHPDCSREWCQAVTILDGFPFEASRVHGF